MNMKKIMPNIMTYIDTTKPYIQPDANSHEGLCVPQIMVDYGSIKTKMKSIPNLHKYMLGSLKEMKTSYAELYNQPNIHSKQIQSKDLMELEDLAKSLGASSIGYTKVSPSDIFDDKAILYANAIVITMEMSHDLIQTAPSKDAEKEIFRTYYELCKMVNILKTFLNDRGYNAEAGPSLGGEVNYPLIAEKANLGIMGKHGLLITPDLGPSIRLAAVYTNIENLPIAEGNDHEWVRSFCQTCNRCVNNCPAGAILKEPVQYGDGTKRCIDYKKCAIPFSTQKGCTVCVKECVFFKTDYTKIKAGFVKD